MSSFHNPADISARQNNDEEPKGSGWLTGRAWLRKPEREWAEQTKSVFASDEDDIFCSAFKTQSEENKTMNQLKIFSNFNRLVNTIPYVQRAYKQDEFDKNKKLP